MKRGDFTPRPGDLIVWRRTDRRDDSCDDLKFPFGNGISCSGMFLLLSITEINVCCLSSRSELITIDTTIDAVVAKSLGVYVHERTVYSDYWVLIYPECIV